MFALPIAMPQFKSIIFYQNSPRRLFCVDANGYAGQSLIHTVFDAGKTKRAFYVINLNCHWLNFKKYFIYW